MSFIVEKQAAEVLPPVYGAMVAVNCTTNVATVVDLASFPATPAGPGYTLANAIAANSAASAAPDQQNPVGKYIRITAQGNDVYYVLGSNFTQLNAITVPGVYTTVNATTGKVTVNGNELDHIANGTFKDVWIPASVSPQVQSPPGSASPCRYVAVIGSGAGAVARIYQSSP